MIDTLFDITDKTVVITGGAGVLGAAMAKGLAKRGARLAILDYDIVHAKEVCKEIEGQGGFALPIKANVLERPTVEESFNACMQSLGRIDVLINGAGGNKREATCKLPDVSYFDLPADAIRWVLDLNCLGTMLPSQVFGRQMAQQGYGCIINIASMNAFRPLTNIPAYSAAKAAVMNFTQWLAVYMAINHSRNVRVNAIAPGFFLTQQNRFLLIDEKTGEMTARAKTIIGHTPAGRFGEADELLGTVVWLISDAAKFVNGVTVPVDGGFNAFSGV